MSNLKNSLIRLGSTHPELRSNIRAILSNIDNKVANTTIQWRTPARGAGQMVQTSYASDHDEWYYRRVENKSERTVQYARTHMDRHPDLEDLEDLEDLRESEWRACSQP